MLFGERVTLGATRAGPGTCEWFEEKWKAATSASARETYLRGALSDACPWAIEAAFNEAFGTGDDEEPLSPPPPPPEVVTCESLQQEYLSGDMTALQPAINLGCAWALAVPSPYEPYEPPPDAPPNQPPQTYPSYTPSTPFEPTSETSVAVQPSPTETSKTKRPTWHYIVAGGGALAALALVVAVTKR